jgi:hypothetical protein
MKKTNNLSKDNPATLVDEVSADQQKKAETTFEEIWQIMKELAISSKETDRLLKETDQQMKETDRRLKETERLIKANSKDIGGITTSNGEIAESYFFNSFKKYPHFAGQDYQLVERNKRCHSKALDLMDEYDLVLYNGSSVAIIEIKYKATKEDVEQILKKAETFKKLFPYYNDFAIYLGLAGFHIYQNAENEAKKQGVAVVKQVGKNMVINDKHLKVF